MKVHVSSIQKSALAFTLVLFAAAAAESRGSVTLQIDWGIRPVDYQRYNGTLLKTADGAEWDVGAFNSGLTMRLAYVGDGSFDETAGFSSMGWVGEPAGAVRAEDLWPGSSYLAGSFAVDSTTKLPMEWLGDIDEADPDAEIYDREEDYYEPLWHGANFAALVYDQATKRAWRVSESAGGSDFATMAAFSSKITMTPVLYPDANYLILIPSVPSRAVYVGAEIPQRSVWMADKGLSAEDVAGIDFRTLSLAAALDLDDPAGVAGGVELAIDSLDVAPASGGEGTVDFAVAWTFRAVGADGEKTPVSSLRGAAALWLETAASLSDLGTAESSRVRLDPAAGAATVRGRAETALFARLVLDLP